MLTIHNRNDASACNSFYSIKFLFTPLFLLFGFDWYVGSSYIMSQKTVPYLVAVSKLGQKCKNL